MCKVTTGTSPPSNKSAAQQLTESSAQQIPMSPTKNRKPKTLFERLGGVSFINMMVSSFFDEIVEDKELRPFFTNISVSALKVHQVKLFEVMYGPEEFKPSQDEMLDFMMATHTRLFRDYGMDETHFDKVATCFVQGLQSFQVDQDIIDECVAELVPLRVVFEYGSKIAMQEKTMNAKQLAKLPIASAKTIGTDTLVVLPEPASIEIPDWLLQALSNKSRHSAVRAWTCELTDRFGAEGDKVIADTFLDMPYMNHHVYLVAFLQLAFHPEDVSRSHIDEMVQMVRFPRGVRNPPLSRVLFDRMIKEFNYTCVSQGMKKHLTASVVKQLQSYRDSFAEMSHQKVGGITATHTLSKDPEKIKVEVDTSKMKALRPRKERASLSRRKGKPDTDSSRSSTYPSSLSEESSGRSRRSRNSSSRKESGSIFANLGWFGRLLSKKKQRNRKKHARAIALLGGSQKGYAAVRR